MPEIALEKGVLSQGIRLGFRDPVLVAIRATDPVNIVGTGGAGIGGVHFLNVEPAVGHLGMAGLAGGSRVFRVASVAGDATQALMDAHRGAIIA